MPPQPPRRNSALPLILVAGAVAICGLFAVVMVGLAVTSDPADNPTRLPTVAARPVEPLSPITVSPASPGSPASPADPPAVTSPNQTVATTYVNFSVPSDYEVSSISLKGIPEAKAFTGGDALEGLYLRPFRLDKTSLTPAERRLYTARTPSFFASMSQKDRINLTTTKSWQCKPGVIWQEKPRMVTLGGEPATRMSFACPSSQGGTNRGEVVELIDSRGWASLLVVQSTALDYVHEKATVDSIFESMTLH